MIGRSAVNDVWSEPVIETSPANQRLDASAVTVTDDAGVAVPVESDSFDLVGILSAVDETAYLWDFASDSIAWESNAANVLGLRTIGEVETGAGYQFLVAPEHIARRHDVIAGSREPAESNGVPYRVQYRFMPGGRRSEASLWLEDHGRWWPGPDGRPARARGVVRVINDRYQEEQRLLYRSDHDELTGQLNRIRLTEAIAVVCERAVAAKQPCAVLMVAVNNLALINETFGFEVGDEVLAAAAKLIKSRLRGGDTIGRYSSNKFGIILNDCGPGAMRIASERFMKAVREATITTSACQLSATISIGGVLLPDQASNANEVLSHALHALDRAKEKRFDCFMSYEPLPHKESTRQRNIAIADEVISALEEHRMVLALQPIVSLKTGKAEHYECLLRLEQPDGTVTLASDFIPVAEQLGLSRLIDRRTLELAVDLLKRHAELSLALNVSGYTANNHEWLVALHRQTGGRKSITSRLIIEITETAAISDINQTIAFVDTLKELGCRVAIDDFGAGYTSFRNLKLLKVDVVKIDGAFIRNLATDPHDIVFIRALRDLATSFGMETVAEWVQDEATVNLLRDAGITYMQGYYCGEPILATQFTANAAAEGARPA
jgi:diguanylate cyclase (GGDEF)-like protein